MKPDFESAQKYVLFCLESQLSPDLFYHNLSHTMDDVLPAATRLGHLAGIPEDDLLLLQTAALFHDIGFIEQYDDHETSSVKIATAQLPRFGYTTSQIERITPLIAVTKLIETPENLLEELIRDADLDVLGRDDFLVRSYHLWEEENIYKTPVSKEEWHLRQIHFLESHSYFTAVSQALRNEGKRQNIEKLKRC